MAGPSHPTMSIPSWPALTLTAHSSVALPSSPTSLTRLVCYPLPPSFPPHPSSPLPLSSPFSGFFSFTLRDLHWSFFASAGLEKYLHCLSVCANKFNAKARCERFQSVSSRINDSCEAGSACTSSILTGGSAFERSQLQMTSAT